MDLSNLVPVLTLAAGTFLGWVLKELSEVFRSGDLKNRKLRKVVAMLLVTYSGVKAFERTRRVARSVHADNQQYEKIRARLASQLDLLSNIDDANEKELITTFSEYKPLRFPEVVETLAIRKRLKDMNVASFAQTAGERYDAICSFLESGEVMLQSSVRRLLTSAALSVGPLTWVRVFVRIKKIDGIGKKQSPTAMASEVRRLLASD